MRRVRPPLRILERAPRRYRRRDLRRQFRHALSFRNLIVGKANEVAASAARTLAGATAVSFNPLVIHGGTGRGKNHLLHAIGHTFLANNQGKRVVSMSAEKFMVESSRAEGQ